MPDVLLSEVEEFAGSNDKGPWVKYTLKNTGGVPVAATFSAELGVTAKALIGRQVSIETKPAQNPKYAPTLVSIAASENGGSFTPPVEPHHRPVVGGDKDRAISRLACLKAAAIVVAAEVPVVQSYDDAALEVMKAAQRFETWVYRDMDDAPFA